MKTLILYKPQNANDTNWNCKWKKHTRIYILLKERKPRLYVSINRSLGYNISGISYKYYKKFQLLKNPVAVCPILSINRNMLADCRRLCRRRHSSLLLMQAWQILIMSFFVLHIFLLLPSTAAIDVFILCWWIHEHNNGI